MSLNTRRILRSLGALGLVLCAATTPCAAVPVISHPTDAAGNPSFFPLSPAYDSGSGGGNVTYFGNRRQPLRGAVAGILSLATRPRSSTDPSLIFDANAFATAPPGQSNPVVVSWVLTRRILGIGPSDCNGDTSIYVPQTLGQSGENTRPHHTVAYDQPGTEYKLEVTVDCLSGGQHVQHIDSWLWKVVADVDSLRALIDLLHLHPVGTAAVPCIVSEDAYRQLVAQVDLIKARLAARDRPGARGALDAFIAFVSTAEGASKIIGTIENPCPCVLKENARFIRAGIPP